MADLICYDSNGLRIDNFYQWDLNQSITIKQVFSPVPVFHFCNRSSEVAYVVSPSSVSVSSVTAHVPNILLQSDEPVIFYLYQGSDNDDSHRTINVTHIPVVPRKRPDDYEYEDDTQHISIAELDARISSLIADIADGTALGEGCVSTDNIANGAITNDKLATMPALSLKGNPTNNRAEVSDIPYSSIKSAFAMVGASSENEGSSGFVPAPSSSQRNQFLRGDGTWATPESGGTAPTTTDGITVELPSEEIELGVVSEGDTVSSAVAQINNAINAIEDLQADKLDSNGSANDVTIQRNASIGFADIPITPITLRELANRLGGWYAKINGKLDDDGNGNSVTVQRNSTYNFADIPTTEITLQELVNRISGWHSAITSKYTKPPTGIPASDLADGVVPSVFVCDSGDDFDTLDTAFRSGKVLVHADYGVMYDGEVGTFYQFRSNSGWGYYLHTCTKNASPEWSTEEHNYDTAPTQGSSAPVTSSGLYTALSGKLGTDGDAYRAASIPFGVVDSTSTATAFTATVNGITELRDGVCAYIRNGKITSAAGCTLNVNNLGAKPIYSTVAATTAVTTTFNVNYTMLFIYNSTRVSGGCWDMYYGYDANTTYTPVKLGFGYAVCSTAAATAAKTASISSYTLTTGGIVAIKFDNDVPAGATLNITSKGAKAIYYRGAAITNGVIKAGDTVTFVYSTYYHVLSIDRDEAPVTSVNGRTGEVDLNNEYLRLYDTATLESLLENVGAVIIPIVLLNQNTVAISDGTIGPGEIRNIFVSASKVIFGTVVSDGNDGWEPDGRVFEIDSQDPSTGQIDLHCIKAGILYQITMNYNGTQYTGTMTETNLALPSAQGVSF